MRRNLSTARTRRFSVSVGARSSLAKMLELTARQASLEEAFIDMTSDAVEFRAPTTAPAKG